MLWLFAGINRVPEKVAGSAAGRSGAAAAVIDVHRQVRRFSESVDIQQPHVRWFQRPNGRYDQEAQDAREGG